MTHFGISEGKGGLKHGSRPLLGMDIFWNCPIYLFFLESFFFAFSFVFRQKFAPKIPAKSAIFSANLSPKIPQNLTFFPANYQKP